MEDLELARRRAGVEFRPGDIMFLHTGFAAWYLSKTPGERARFVRARRRRAWRTARRCAATCGTRTWPPWPLTPSPWRCCRPNRDQATGFLHRMLIGQFGMALGELWWTEDLAADCAADGVHEMFLTSAPLHVPGGIGSHAQRPGHQMIGRRRLQ